MNPLTASAAALIFNPQGEVLIVKPTYKAYWNLPGGHIDIENGETPYDAAVREVGEELGIAPPIGRLLVHAWITVPGRGAQVLYLFDGGTLGPGEQRAITLQESELSEYRFHYPAEKDDGVVPPDLRHVWEQALLARREDRIAYVSA
ncbi:NUDIX domain-containing protein [Streptomyces sp. NPDC088789]|uniref:NUDIX domain-containing protein n=1 Tax=Streptomyces sp. NPDC088789 TaxID=3365899 RepID=UPI00382386DE